MGKQSPPRSQGGLMAPSLPPCLFCLVKACTGVQRAALGSPKLEKAEISDRAALLLSPFTTDSRGGVRPKDR